MEKELKFLLEKFDKVVKKLENENKENKNIIVESKYIIYLYLFI